MALAEGIRLPSRPYANRVVYYNDPRIVAVAAFGKQSYVTRQPALVRAEIQVVRDELAPEASNMAAVWSAVQEDDVTHRQVEEIAQIQPRSKSVAVKMSAAQEQTLVKRDARLSIGRTSGPRDDDQIIHLLNCPDRRALVQEQRRAVRYLNRARCSVKAFRKIKDAARPGRVYGPLDSRSVIRLVCRARKIRHGHVVIRAAGRENRGSARQCGNKERNYRSVIHFAHHYIIPKNRRNILLHTFNTVV